MVHASGQKSKMNDRDLLLIKAIISVVVGLAGIGVFYLIFDNTLIGLLVGLTFATWYLFRTYKSIILPYQDKGAEIIFNGFNLKGTDNLHRSLVNNNLYVLHSQ